MSDPLAAFEGGTPVPEGPLTLRIPAVAKQSVTFLSDAAEQIAGRVEMDQDPEQSLGTVTLGNQDGSASGVVTFRVDQLRTNNATRDEHLRGSDWLDAARYPELKFTLARAERVRPTVFQITGTFAMHGVEQPVAFPANLRFFSTFPHLGDNVVRISGAFDLELAKFGVTNPAIGTPVMAKVWRVGLTILAFRQEP